MMKSGNMKKNKPSTVTFSETGSTTRSFSIPKSSSVHTFNSLSSSSTKTPFSSESNYHKSNNTNTTRSGSSSNLLLKNRRCLTCNGNNNNTYSNNRMNSQSLIATTTISNSNTTNNGNQIQSIGESDRFNIASTAGASQSQSQYSNNQQQQHLQPSPVFSSSSIKRNSSIASVTFVEELQVSRRPSVILQDLLSARRPSAIMAALRPNYTQNQRPRIMSMLQEDPQNGGSSKSINTVTGSGTLSNGPNCEMAIRFKRKNRRIGDDALSTALSALYCKLLVILGVSMPVTEIISSKIPAEFYQGFYVYLYLGSIIFVIFIYVAHMKSRALFNIIKSYHEQNSNVHIKRRADRFGSFYLRVGAITFGIGTMVYSGLEFGQYFELSSVAVCKNFFVALTPAARMALVIVQMQFIFLNTTELDMARHKVITRFGLMHMVATNLCEWLYVLVEETKHEIYHIMHSEIDHEVSRIVFRNTQKSSSSSIQHDNNTNDLHQQILTEMISNSTMDSNLTENLLSAATVAASSTTEDYVNCQRTNIMGSLVQNASPFLFPCTIEYSLICAVILYEMWKKVKSIPNIAKSRNDLHQKPNQRMAHHFSVDCSRARRGIIAGIMIIVMTIICMIMYFVLHVEPGYELLAMQEVTICETVMYSLTTVAVIAAMIRMRDLKFLNRKNDKHSSSISLDCTLLVLAQTGTYLYAMFSIMGSYFSIAEGTFGGREALLAEVIGLFQTSIQTLFILNASWRRCKGAQQQRNKPGRELITFLLIANVCMWFIHTLIKGRAAFRSSHLEFFGIWAWTIITHVSMPLAIFYRFHSTICLFEIWKSAYKVKGDH